MKHPRIRTFLLLAITMIATACAERGEIFVVPTSDTSANIKRIFVATTRQKSDKPYDFNSLRTSTLSMAQYDISIPPTHEVGQIEWPKHEPDITTDFVTTNVVPFKSKRQFTNAIHKTARQSPTPDEAIIFIHGYNNTFAEGLYRWAQVIADTNQQSAAVHYSWPATQKASQYIRDRDSVLFARDGLQDLLQQLADADFKQIVIVAHSIGSSLLMETLRQLSLQSDSDTMNRIGGVVLMSPDVDINLFETQIRRIKPIPRPFIIFGDRKDKALKLSAFLTSYDSRVGQLTKKDSAVLKRYNIDIVDLSDVTDGADFLNHSVAITSPTILSILRTLPQRVSPTETFSGQQIKSIIERFER